MRPTDRRFRFPGMTPNLWVFPMGREVFALAPSLTRVQVLGKRLFMDTGEQRRIIEGFLRVHAIDFPAGARMSHLARRVRSRFPSITEAFWPYPKKWTGKPVEELARRLNEIDPHKYQPVERRYYHPVTGSRKPDQSFYQTREWRRLRYFVLKERGPVCECCGARPASKKSVHVDHIKPISKFPELRLEKANLQVLCSDCNKGKGAWDDTDWRPQKGL